MARARLDHDLVTRSAVVIVDRHGFEGLSLSSVAEALGVGPSALYSHVDGLDGLRESVAVAATRGLTEVVRDAAIGTSGDDALHAVGRAYREYARQHPGRFTATLRVSANSEPLQRASAELESVFVLLCRTRGLHDDLVGPVARNARSSLHGFVALQHTQGGSDTADDDYRIMLDALCRFLDG